MHLVAESISREWPDVFLGSREALGDLTVYLKPDGALSVFQSLHDDPRYDYDYIVDVVSSIRSATLSTTFSCSKGRYSPIHIC